MVMYKTAATSLLNLEDRWFLASTERLHPLKLSGSALDVSSAATHSGGLNLDMPVPVRAFTPSPEEFRFEFASLSGGNTLSLIPPRVNALKDSRQISHRQRLPRVRAPPSDLWNLLDAKSPSSQQHTTSLPCGPTAPSDASSIHYNEDKAASVGGPMAVDRRPSAPMSRQSPIGTGRPQGNESGSRQFEDHTNPWGSGSPAISSSRLSPPSPTSDDTILVSLSPGIAARRRTPTPLSRSFFDVLLENKRRHPHAPTMVSMLNPLREQVTFRAWACIPVRSGGHPTKEQLALPSSRFQNSLPSLYQSTRSRQACDLACSNLRVNKRFYLRKTSYHCSHCKKDSIYKKLLVILYFGNHLRNLFKPSLYGRPTYARSTNALKLDTKTNSALSNLMGRPAMVVDSESFMDEDSDILDTPLLKDLDDFDDYEDALDDMDEGIFAGEDSLELEGVDADGDTEMHDADLN